MSAKIHKQKKLSKTCDETFQNAIATYKVMLANRIASYNEDIDERTQQISDTREILDDLDNLASCIT